MEKKNVFQHFKKNKQANFSSKSSLRQVFFCLKFDDYGAYIEITNQQGNPVDVNFLSFSGAIRNVLRTLESINEKNSFVIDWEKESKHVYLSDHSYLLWQLKHCNNIIDETGSPVIFQEETGEIRVIISEKKDSGSKDKSMLFEGRVSLFFNSNLIETFEVLTEDFVFADGKIVEVKPMGNNFSQINYFRSEFHEADLSKYLSLLFSYVENCRVTYKDYKIKRSEDGIFAEPALIFEKIDEDESLIMRVGQTLPDFDFEFLEQFELFHYAEVNQMEKVINVKIIEQEPVEDLLNIIKKSLTKHIPRKGSKKLADFVQEGNLFIVPKEVASGFIYQELPELLLSFKLFGAEKLKSYKISTGQPKLDLKLSHGVDFLEGDVTLDFGGEKLNLFDVLNQYNKNRYISLSNGMHAIINENYIHKLQRLFKKKQKKVQVSFFDLPIVEELIDENAAKTTFKKSRAVFEGFNKLKKSPKVKSRVNAKLRPYQEQGVKWLKYLEKNNLGGCLADDMGLGKTLQTLTLLATIYPEKAKPTLIVMPKSLLFNWAAEVDKFCPQISHYTYYGNTCDLEEAMVHNLIFITYGMLRSNIEAFAEQEFHYVILDESQNIKNINTQTTKAVMMLKSDHRLALSGTPVENNLGELYSLFRFLTPSMFSTLENFSRNYANPIQKNSDVRVIEELRKKIYPFILRRLKSEVLKELPSKIEQTLYVEMSAKQKAFYEQRRQFYVTAIKSQIAQKGVSSSQFFIFQALNELRQIASIPENKTDGKISSPKLEVLIEQIIDAVENGHKMLVFVNFLNAIELIGEKLDNANIDFVSMSGSTRNRQEIIQRFQNDSECRVFLMTLKTGGTGLNLTAADTVFIFDPWWNVAAENQAIDRAHRIGQQNKVLTYKLITKETIEEKILLLQEKKKELFENIVSADTASIKSLSEEDINYILG
ncbi:DEAD/DEAH box helicase [Chondrinema litorale]|uniref:DEAD/DEAH box helicase n=1 Tax=Chondrinema litorale TaxID=2994555 RepID=UPI00254287FB|nr:DEAD/DEAH box helicase [Chondrinema litorale]UZR97114.1 DEAD/DEAH box helicase [Chondrinema litorale]